VETNSFIETDTFFRQYTSEDTIVKYSRATAGYGINYLLDHDYKSLYLKALQSLPAAARQKGIRILEFGCGAGMNLLHLVSVLSRGGNNVESAIGTDFSPVLIEAAVQEAKNYLRAEDRRKVQFCVARNETLIDNLSSALGKNRAELESSFHLMLGVNTIRYCHRTGKQVDCVQDIFDLLVPGGICIVIDMNNRFPAFRSALKNRLRGRKKKEAECYLPTLEEYTDPFAKTGFEVIRRDHFCWIPHSAGRLMSGLLQCLSPVLNTVAKSRAMRSLVVSRKPANVNTRVPQGYSE